MGWEVAAPAMRVRLARRGGGGGGGGGRGEGGRGWEARCQVAAGGRGMGRLTGCSRERCALAERALVCARWACRGAECGRRAVPTRGRERRRPSEGRRGRALGRYSHSRSPSAGAGPLRHRGALRPCAGGGRTGSMEYARVPARPETDLKASGPDQLTGAWRTARPGAWNNLGPVSNNETRYAWNVAADGTATAHGRRVSSSAARVARGGRAVVARLCALGRAAMIGGCVCPGSPPPASPAARERRGARRAVRSRHGRRVIAAWVVGRARVHRVRAARRARGGRSNPIGWLLLANGAVIALIGFARRYAGVRRARPPRLAAGRRLGHPARPIAPGRCCSPA